MNTSDEYLTEPVTTRLATRADLPALTRLADLDSGHVPPGRLLLAELRGSVVAAISLESGAVFADPFVSTAGVVKSLRAEAAEMDLADVPESGRRSSLIARVRDVRRRRQPGELASG
jgi:hypothetical protein